MVLQLIRVWRVACACHIRACLKQPAVLVSLLPDLMDCNLPGSSVHGIIQARILESGLPFPTPGDLPDPEIKPTTPSPLELAGGFFTTEPPGRLEGARGRGYQGELCGLLTGFVTFLKVMASSQSSSTVWLLQNEYLGLSLLPLPTLLLVSFIHLSLT